MFLKEPRRYPIALSARRAVLEQVSGSNTLSLAYFKGFNGSKEVLFCEVMPSSSTDDLSLDNGAALTRSRQAAKLLRADGNKVFAFAKFDSDLTEKTSTSVTAGHADTATGN